MENMKQKISIAFEFLFILIGTWLFISNILDSGYDERFLAGLGSALIFTALLIKEIRLKKSISKLKTIWKIIVLGLGISGIWIFISNVLDSGYDERFYAGLGGAMVLISFYIKDFKGDQILENKSLNLKKGLLILIIFTLYGLQKKDIRYVERKLDSIDTDLYSLDNRIDDVDSDVSDLGNRIDDIDSDSDVSDLDNRIDNIEYRVYDIEHRIYYGY
jgi:peptidoglycan hydrolase CwlO-like protein